MLVLISAFIGALIGALIRIKQGGNLLDALQYAAVFGIVCAILALFANVAIIRTM